MSAAARREAIAAAAGELPDGELLELHREVSRLAAAAYMRIPGIRAKQAAHYRAARAAVPSRQTRGTQPGHDR